MNAFMAGALTLDAIFARLRADFARDGHPNVEPDTAFYDDPPSGMGYENTMAMQGFLNRYVNGDKARYNLAAATNIFVSQVAPTKVVGNLAALIFAKQQ